MPRIRASDRKITNGHGISVPGTYPKPSVVNSGGKLETPCGPRTISASPRNRASVPRVTTSDGSPNRAISVPFIRPPRAPSTITSSDGDPDRDPGGPQEAEDRARQAGHRLDRQVDLARDDHEGHRHGHDRHLHEGGEQVREVARREEHRRQLVAEDDEAQQHDDEQRLPAHEPARDRRVRSSGAPRGGEPLDPAGDERVGAHGDQDHDAVDGLEPELRQADEDEGVGDEARGSTRRSRRR